MVIHEFGVLGKPTLLLLPRIGTTYEGEYKKQIETLKTFYHVLVCSYTGFEKEEIDEFDENKITEFDIYNETVLLEKYVKDKYSDRLFAAYGCEIGADILSLLLLRKVINISNAIVYDMNINPINGIRLFFKTNKVKNDIYSLAYNKKIPSSISKEMLNAQGEYQAILDSYTKMYLDTDYTDVDKKSIKNQIEQHYSFNFDNPVDSKGNKVTLLLKQGSKDEDILKANALFPEANFIKVPTSYDNLFYNNVDAWYIEIKRITELD